MLKLRIITAIVLLAVVLPLLFQDSPEPFVAFALLFVSAGVWEWGRLNGLASKAAMAMAACFAACLGVFWNQNGLAVPLAAWFVSAGLWSVAAPWLLRKGIHAWAGIPVVVRVALGIFALAFAWLAMAQARTVGVNHLLSILALVWMADIAAYFGGKAFGRRKLAPHISPGKSWEGAITGWLGVLSMAVVWIWADAQFNPASQSIFSLVFHKQPVWSWVGFSGLAVASVIGDLIESLVKRSAGFKDSSHLLPGHGGVLDRIDALLPVLPLAALLVALSTS